jgi:hypothetical protein
VYEILHDLETKAVGGRDEVVVTVDASASASHELAGLGRTSDWVVTGCHNGGVGGPIGKLYVEKPEKRWLWWFPAAGAAAVSAGLLVFYVLVLLDPNRWGLGVATLMLTAVVTVFGTVMWVYAASGPDESTGWRDVGRSMIMTVAAFIFIGEMGLVAALGLRLLSRFAASLGWPE